MMALLLFIGSVVVASHMCRVPREAVIGADRRFAIEELVADAVPGVFVRRVYEYRLDQLPVFDDGESFALVACTSIKSLQRAAVDTQLVNLVLMLMLASGVVCVASCRRATPLRQQRTK